MKRRLRMAGTAMAAFLVPACTGVQPESTVIKPAPVPPGGSQRLAAHPVMVPAPRGSQTAEKFADRRTDPTPTVASRSAPLADQPLPRGEETADESTGTTVLPPPLPALPPPVETPLPENPPASNALPASLPPAVEPPSAEPPKVILPVRNTEPGKEPPTDAEGVIRPQWPVLKGSLPLVDPNKPKEPEKPAPIVVPVVPKPAEDPLTPPTPVLPPPPLPGGVLGSTPHQSNASPMTPESSPLTPVEHTEVAATTTGETALIRAIRSFQQNRPDAAVEELKNLDPASQQALLALMPAMVRIGEGKLAAMPANELDQLIDQIARVPQSLRSKASLRADNVRLCREVHTFGHVEPFPPGHTFRPGDIVYLYQEMGNFSCDADGKDGKFAITLTSALEMKNSAGIPVWRADPKEAADRVSSVPHDYYRNFRLCVPAVPPGAYTLSVKTTDKPTGREVTRTIELHVGPK